MSGSAVGSVVGFFVGNAISPGFGGQIGMMAGAWLGGQIAPQHIKAPSIGDAQRQTSQAGAPCPAVYGHPAPFAGNHIDGEPIARKITKEVKQGKGGSSTVSDEDHFILTYCIRVAEPIGAYLRIWRRGQVVYDARALTDIPGWDGDMAEEIAEYHSEMQAANKKWLEKCRMYLGGEDQLPDPALEAIHGVGNTHYYRGRSHIVVEDDDVTDTGGAVPAYMFEVTQNVTVNVAPMAGFFLTSAGDFYDNLIHNGVEYEQADMPPGTAPNNLRYAAANGRTVIATSSDGHIYRSRDGGRTFEVLNGGVLFPGTGGRICYANGRWVTSQWQPGLGYRTLMSPDDGDTWETGPTFSTGSENDIAGGNGIFLFASAGYYTSNLYRSLDGKNWTVIDGGEYASMNWNGARWFIASNDGSYRYSTDNCNSLQVCPGTTYGIGYGITPMAGGYVVATQGGKIYKTDALGTAFVEKHTDARSFYCAASHGNIAIASTGGGGSAGNMISLDYGETWSAMSGVGYNVDVIYSAGLTASSVAIPDAPDSYIDPETGEIVVLEPGDTYNSYDVSLQFVEEDIAARAGVPVGRFDASALAGYMIPGYLIAEQSTGADCLQPLMTAFFHDLPEVDGVIRAVLRGGPILATITDDDLVLTDSDDDIRGQILEYPLKVTVFTQEPEADYAAIPQTSLQISPDVKSSGEQTLNLPIPFGADRTMQIAEVWHSVLLSKAEGVVGLRLPEAFSKHTLSDPVWRDDRRWIIIESNYAEGIHSVKIQYDRASNYGSSAVGTAPVIGTPPSTGLVGPTLLSFMNIPALVDADDRVGFYVGIAGVMGSWHGGVVQASTDSGVSYTDLAVITSASIMGSLIDALPDASSDYVDEWTVLRVRIYAGDLDSITVAQLLQEKNAFVIGMELLQFTTATEVSDGVYELTGLTRGRLNTEAVAHAAGSRFTLLNAPVFCEVPISWIGQTITLRAVGLGTTDEANPTQTEVWTQAMSQTEWNPVMFSGVRDGSNNVSISWNGRARLGSTVNPIHSANFTGYRVKITKAAVTVTKALTSSQSYYYSAAEQTADFGSAVGALTISIEAMNRITGPSTALTGAVA